MKSFLDRSIEALVPDGWVCTEQGNAENKDCCAAFATFKEVGGLFIVSERLKHCLDDKTLMAVLKIIGEFAFHPSLNKYLFEYGVLPDLMAVFLRFSGQAERNTVAWIIYNMSICSSSELCAHFFSTGAVYFLAHDFGKKHNYTKLALVNLASYCSKSQMRTLIMLGLCQHLKLAEDYDDFMVTASGRAVERVIQFFGADWNDGEPPEGWWVVRKMAGLDWQCENKCPGCLRRCTGRHKHGDKCLGPLVCHHKRK